MISNEERREAADRFYAAADALEAGEQMTDGELADAVYDAAVVTVEHCTGDAAEVDRALLRRLADLIGGPTCRNVCDGREFECSACGMQWRLLDREGELEEWAHVRKPRFCPSCGAEVVA